jgi:hypothetical protein
VSRVVLTSCIGYPSGCIYINVFAGVIGTILPEFPS